MLQARPLENLPASCYDTCARAEYCGATATSPVGIGPRSAREGQFLENASGHPLNNLIGTRNIRRRPGPGPLEWSGVVLVPVGEGVRGGVGRVRGVLNEAGPAGAGGAVVTGGAV